MKGEVEDWIAELPPLDGAEDEPNAEDGFHDDLVPDADADASLDDSTAEDLEVDDGVDIADDDPHATDDDERWEADVGEPELDLADDANDDGGDADAPGVGDSELDVDDDLPPSTDDAGEEGTTDAVEQSIDEELPALDADDEGDFEEALLLETGLAVPAQEGPRWAHDPWQRLASEDRPMHLAVPDDDAVAATAMCTAPRLLLSVTVAGRLLIEEDSGETRGGRLLPASLTAGRAGPPVIALARKQGSTVLWAANRTGLLAHSADLGRTWSAPIDLGKSIVALALAPDGSIVVLASRGEQLEIVSSADGSAWGTKAAMADGLPLQLASTATTWLAAGATSLAIGDSNGVWMARGGENFRRFASATPACGVFLGSGPDAPLAFIEAAGDIDEGARLIGVKREERLEILAELVPPDDDRTDAPAIFAMAWDETSRSLQVALSTVICTVVPPSKIG